MCSRTAQVGDGYGGARPEGDQNVRGGYPGVTDGRVHRGRRVEEISCGRRGRYYRHWPQYGAGEQSPPAEERPGLPTTVRWRGRALNPLARHGLLGGG